MLISQRGVVFFRSQNITVSDQKALARKLGELSGKPETSKHALANSKRVPANEPGGDTLWASGYETYERCQVFFDQARTKSFIQQLTFCKPNVLEVVKKHGVELSNGERGSPENTGLDFKASHPVSEQSLIILQMEEPVWARCPVYDLIAKNYDIQVCFRWNAGDVAMRDNRWTFHSLTK
ncbi:unnamed protein product, partial [Clonostachys chloroleuca]